MLRFDVQFDNVLAVVIFTWLRFRHKTAREAGVVSTLHGDFIPFVHLSIGGGRVDETPAELLADFLWRFLEGSFLLRGWTSGSLLCYFGGRVSFCNLTKWRTQFGLVSGLGKNGFVHVDVVAKGKNKKILMSRRRVCACEKSRKCVLNISDKMPKYVFTKRILLVQTN